MKLMPGQAKSGRSHCDSRDRLEFPLGEHGEPVVLRHQLLENRRHEDMRGAMPLVVGILAQFDFCELILRSFDASLVRAEVEDLPFLIEVGDDDRFGEAKDVLAPSHPSRP